MMLATKITNDTKGVISVVAGEAGGLICPRMARMDANGCNGVFVPAFFISAHSRHSRALFCMFRRRRG